MAAAFACWLCPQFYRMPNSGAEVKEEDYNSQRMYCRVQWIFTRWRYDTTSAKLANDN